MLIVFTTIAIYHFNDFIPIHRGSIGYLKDQLHISMQHRKFRSTKYNFALANNPRQKAEPFSETKLKKAG